MTAIERLLATAIREIGYIEKETNSQLDSPTANAGDEDYTKYARDFDQKFPNWYNGKKNGFAWCDMFVDWCFLTTFGYEAALNLLCQPEKSAGAGCTYSLAYYEKKGQYYKSNPQPGDQIFFSTARSKSNVSHTGIVEKVIGSTVYTIEGNTSNRVARRTYAITDTYIVGYGRPDWSIVQKVTAPAPSAAPATGQKYKVGDEVNFTGTKHYSNASAASGVVCKPGKAKVTQVYPTGKHPYHLVAMAGGGSNVYGWVDAADIGGNTTGQAVAVGSTVTIKAGAVYGGLATSRGAKVPSYVSGSTRRYTVKQIATNKGVQEALLGEINSWVAISYLTVV